ncbi:DMT family transporter [bacterium]|nr:DMT family transporter [bacterium]
MRTADLIRLTALAAIWGGSFVFMRVAAPALGPFTTAGARVLLAGLLLLAYIRLVRFDAQWRRHWFHYALVGVVNSAVPFSLYSYAALHIPASYSVILNATAPLFGAVFAAVWLNERLTPRRLAGLAVGTAGVALVARGKGGGVAEFDASFALAVAACLGAALCYALSGVYLKRRAAAVPPLAMAGASQLMAGAALLPLAVAMPPAGWPSAPVIGSVVALAVLCSAVAYLLYFRLLADVGPARALTVTYLMPVFGMGWGALFLNERITPAMLAGCALVIGGTLLVVRAPVALRTARAATTPSRGSTGP